MRHQCLCRRRKYICSILRRAPSCPAWRTLRRAPLCPAWRTLRRAPLLSHLVKSYPCMYFLRWIVFLARRNILAEHFLRLGDRRDRPCRDPLKRDSDRYAITLITRENPFAEPDLPSRRFSPAILHVGITEVGPICYNMVHGSPVAKLPCFAPPQSFLKRFALRWWQLKCRFAASSAPKLHIFHPPTRPASAFTSACKHCYTGINLILSRPNCPVLDAWAKL